MLTVCARATASVVYGLGRHTSTLDIEDVEKALLFNVVSLLLGLISFTIPKLAVATLLNRLLNPSCLQRCVIFGMCAAVTVLAVVNIALWVTMCKPLDSIWRIRLVMNGQATCMDAKPLIDYTTVNGGELSLPLWLIFDQEDRPDVLTSLAVYCFVDFYYAAYPRFILNRLQMPLPKKLGLSLALGLGVWCVLFLILLTWPMPFLRPDYLQRCNCSNDPLHLDQRFAPPI